MSALIIAFVVSLVFMILYYLISLIIRYRRFVYYIDQIPGPPCTPIFGNVRQIMGTPDQLWINLRKLSSEYYPIYRLWFTKYAIVNIVNPDDAEILLTNQKNITKGPFYDFLHHWFGTGIVTSTGKKWHVRRKMLTSAFHFNILRKFTAHFDDGGQRMVDHIKSYNGDVTLDLPMLVTKYTLSTIFETAMGTSLTRLENNNNEFYQMYKKSIHELQQLIMFRLQNPWFHSNFIFSLSKWKRYQDKYLDVAIGFTKKIIGERKKLHEDTEDTSVEEFKGNNKFTMLKAFNKKLAVLDFLITAFKNGLIDDDGIRQEIDTIMFGGHDSTSAGISFTVLLLAEHPDIQKRAREEVDEVLKNSNGHFTITQLQQLNYLERCIKESLRLYPSFPLIARSLTEDLQLKKYLLPAGTVISLHIFDIHRDPNFWPDPCRFDPDRFLPENIHNQHRFAYIPFSGGLRSCIGQKYAMLQLKAMIGHLLHNFDFESVDLASNARLLRSITIMTDDPLRVKFIPRKLS